jgi:hypothetical protein
MPAEWFTQETFGILRELCAHLVYAKWVREGISRLKQRWEAEGKDWALDDEYSAKLSAMWGEHRFQTQQIGSLSTKLRLTNQSRYAPQTAEREREKLTAVVARKPWEDFGEDARQ